MVVRVAHRGTSFISLINFVLCDACPPARSRRKHQAVQAHTNLCVRAANTGTMEGLSGRRHSLVHALPCHDIEKTQRDTLCTAEF